MGKLLLGSAVVAALVMATGARAASPDGAAPAPHRGATIGGVAPGPATTPASPNGKAGGESTGTPAATAGGGYATGGYGSSGLDYGIGGGGYGASSTGRGMGGSGYGTWGTSAGYWGTDNANLDRAGDPGGQYVGTSGPGSAAASDTGSDEDEISNPSSSGPLITTSQGGHGGAEQGEHGGAEAATPAGPGGRVQHVSMSGLRFVPPVLDVHVDDVVEWKNEDFVAHTATAVDGSFDTGTIDAGQSKRVKMTKQGEIPYFCRYHAQMKGTLDVQAGAPLAPARTREPR